MEQNLQEIDLDLTSPEAGDLLAMTGEDLLAAARVAADPAACSGKARECMEDMVRSVGSVPDADRVPLMATVALCLMWSVGRATGGGE